VNTLLCRLVGLLALSFSLVLTGVSCESKEKKTEMNEAFDEFHEEVEKKQEPRKKRKKRKMRDPKHTYDDAREGAVEDMDGRRKMMQERKQKMKKKRKQRPAPSED